MRRFDTPGATVVAGEGAAGQPAAPPGGARELALRILFEVESRRAFADRLLEERLQRGALSEVDRRLVTQLVQGTLRMQRRLDWVADHLLRVDRAGLPVWIRLCLRLGIYQLLFLDRVPRHAAVDETVRLARKYGHPGTAGLVNAVLRRLPDALAGMPFPDRESQPIAHLGVLESHPDWIVERWVARYGYERAAALLSANNQPAAVTVRVNRLRASRDAILKRLRAAGIEAAPGRLCDSCLRLPAGAGLFASGVFTDGWVTVQDEGEALVGLLVNPRPGERILDLCAAPGGKLSHLVELARGQALVVGVELVPARARRTRQGMRRLGHDGVALVCADGRSFGRETRFDRVLVDAPCSGLGVLRRRSDARWRKSPELLAEMVELQADLLARAARLVRAGGAIVYSVCSFEPEECETQLDDFLERHPAFQVERPGPGFPAAVVESRGCYRVLHDEYGADGVFGVRLRHVPPTATRDGAAGRGMPHEGAGEDRQAAADRRPADRPIDDDASGT
ncbi:MAG: 16S rRNA (cytosine(967)-C(5))-methyltransferase RsmB [Candidatus Eiseniibacteriota bacterium]